MIFRGFFVLVIPGDGRLDQHRPPAACSCLWDLGPSGPHSYGAALMKPTTIAVHHAACEIAASSIRCMRWPMGSPLNGVMGDSLTNRRISGISIRRSASAPARQRAWPS